jgi:hypothetical protein
MTAMTVAPTGHPARERTLAVMLLVSGWSALRLSVARCAARRRLARSITHLDDRLLDDIGLAPQKRGFAERLIRRYAAGGEIWRAADRQTSRRQNSN